MVSNNVDDFLAHYGTKGMRWGVRKERDVEIVATRTLRDGSTLTMTKDPAPPIGRMISKLSPAFREKMANSANLTLLDDKGKKIGDASLFKESKDSLNLVWIGVKKSERGKGYASAAVGAAIDFAKSQGMKKMTLEVPGDSPDARHIYEKFGFKAVKNLSPTDDVWGGLTAMELNLKN